MYILKIIMLCSVVLLSGHLCAFGGDDEKFRLQANGTVQVEGYRFADMKSYVSSEYFKRSGKRCGTKRLLASDKKSAVAKSVVDCTLMQTWIRSEYWPVSATYVIPVWFHVIYQSDGTGNISDARISAQIQVLNEDYGAHADTLGAEGVNTSIQFELAGITRTLNNDWFNEDSGGIAERNYKTVLREDTNKYLNVYTNLPAGGDLGYAYYPQDYAGQVLDGIVLQYETVGGRDNGFSDYDQGRTLVHEMGHYLGLMHTFESGSLCTNGYISGDLIWDTASEQQAHYECRQTYSCGSADPIHNYMNYTDDLCVTGFTKEQANRAVCSLVNYRPTGYRIVLELSDVVIPPLIELLLLRK
jgi:hypothetical protein